MFHELRKILIFAFIAQSAMTKFILIEVDETQENVGKIGENVNNWILMIHP